MTELLTVIEHTKQEADELKKLIAELPNKEQILEAAMELMKKAFIAGYTLKNSR